MMNPERLVCRHFMSFCENPTAPERYSNVISFTLYLQRNYMEMETMMLRKVFKTGNSVVISLPKNALEILCISEGSEVTLDLDRENR
jgi:hypothetical protein